MLFKLKRILMPWTMLTVGVAPLLALLLVLPGQFTRSPSFTILLVATYFAAGVRLYGRLAGAASARAAWILPPALLVGLLVDVGAFVHLELPFWSHPAVSHSFAARSLEAPEPADHSVYIVEHGWHTGLVLDTADLAATDLPYFATLRQHRFVEVGWGDAEFFQADDPGILTAADAMLTPGPAVLHVASFDQPVESYFKAEVFHRIPVTASGAGRIGRYVADSFADRTSAAPQATGKGNYGPDSRFVAATGSYYFPHTCNVWTAEALQAGGLETTPALAVTSRALLHQVRQIAKANP